MKEFINKLIESFLGECVIYAENYEKALNIANELTEEYNNGWIPCSDRLPEEYQMVLTCDKDGWVSTHINMPYKGVKNDFECGYYTAWQPLPAPYKEGVTENE